MRAFKWILLVAILGLWGTGTVWDLQTIAAQIETHLEGSGLDEYSRAHLEETKARIEAALEAGLERSF